MAKAERNVLRVSLESDEGTTCSDVKAGDDDAGVPSQSSDIVKNPTVWSERLGANAVKSGAFGEHMDVMIRNDGPVTIIVDSEDSIPRERPVDEIPTTSKAKDGEKE